MNFCASAEVSALTDRVLLRVGAGVAVSIVLHGLLLFAYRQGMAPPWRDNAAPRDALVVTLRAPVPQLLPEPIPEPVPKAQPERTPTPVVKAKPAVKAEKQTARKAEAQTASTRPAPAQSHPAPDVIALPESGAVAPDTFTVAPPSGAPQSDRQFDPDAARRFAREIATKPDPARAGMAVEQIPPKPYATETKAARMIAQAKRRDCKDGVPGGLLAPIFLALDKKDSGCKW